MGVLSGSQKYHVCSGSHISVKYDAISLTPSDSLWFRCDRNLKTKNKTITKNTNVNKWPKYYKKTGKYESQKWCGNTKARGWEDLAG